MRTVSGFEIKVKREELLGKLRENRSNHLKHFEAAITGYHEKLRELAAQFSEQVEKDVAKADTKIFSIEKPRSYANVYDTLIGMLEMSVEDEITLDGDRYKMWCEDRWDWKDRFVGTVAAYSAGMSL